MNRTSVGVRLPRALALGPPRLMSIVLCLVGPGAVQGQEPVAPEAAADTAVAESTWTAGYAAGDSLAAQTPVSGAAGRVLAGAVGGFLLAPGAFLTLGGHPEALLPGAGLVVLGSEVSPTSVPALPDSTRPLVSAYRAGFEAGFRDREAHRRRLVTWGAAGVSAAVTFTALLLLFTGGYT